MSSVQLQPDALERLLAAHLGGSIEAAGVGQGLQRAGQSPLFLAGGGDGEPRGGVPGGPEGPAEGGPPGGPKHAAAQGAGRNPVPAAREATLASQLFIRRDAIDQLHSLPGNWRFALPGVLLLLGSSPSASLCD